MSTNLSKPIRSKFQFRDQKGNILTLESLQLMQFLNQLSDRTGGSASDLISVNSAATSSNTSSITSLQESVEAINVLDQRLTTLEQKTIEIEEKMETD